MAFSLEARVPFLDYRLVEFLFTLPASYLIRDGWTKWLLRQAMAGTLPEKIRWRRDKMGFVTPEVRWLQAGRHQIVDLFSDSQLRSRPFLNADKILEQLDTTLANTQNVSTTVWRWINLELWLRQYNVSL